MPLFSYIFIVHFYCIVFLIGHTEPSGVPLLADTPTSVSNPTGGAEAVVLRQAWRGVAYNKTHNKSADSIQETLAEGEVRVKTNAVKGDDLSLKLIKRLYHSI